MKIANLPRNIAIIPDGNRRWARSNSFSIFKGYEIGVKKFMDFSEWCLGYGINSIAVWAFSTENFSRSRNEVNVLFKIYNRVARDKEILRKLHENRTRLKVIGNLGMLPKHLIEGLGRLEEETSIYKERVINMLMGYGGQDDILHAARALAQQHADPSEISKESFGRYLISSSMPDIDFIIRTSGEHRLSGLMPWQTSYSELYFSRKLWPEFTRNDLRRALLDYNERQRRFGR